MSQILVETILVCSSFRHQFWLRIFGFTKFITLNNSLLSSYKLLTWMSSIFMEYDLVSSCCNSFIYAFTFSKLHFLVLKYCKIIMYTHFKLIVYLQSCWGDKQLYVILIIMSLRERVCERAYTIVTSIIYTYI